VNRVFAEPPVASDRTPAPLFPHAVPAGTHGRRYGTRAVRLAVSKGGIVNDTIAPTPKRRRWGLAALAAGLTPLAVAGCTAPGGETGPSPTLPPPTGACRIIDFDKATVASRPSPATSPRYLLTVTGTKPSVSQTVRLVPVTYIRQPEYWAIEVTACDPPGVGLPQTGPYTSTLDLTGVTGTKGIEVVGATRSQSFDLATGPA
jgi:hypothetical protein